MTPYFRAAVAVIASFCVVLGLWNLHDAHSGLTETHIRIGTIPATIFRPTDATPAPVVVIAHGFAGSQQLMQSFAVTLARNGYVAISFDLPGHGQNPAPMAGGIADDTKRNQVLRDALTAVVAFAETAPGGNGRVALLGHSMATDILIRVAAARPGIEATVAVSMFSPAVTPSAPRNLLAITGALEPAMLRDEASRVVAMVSGMPPQDRTTYGSFTDGTARRMALAGGVEHIAVLFSAQTMFETLGWLNQVFAHTGSGYIDHRGPWLGLLYLGLVALAWPLSHLLPVVSSHAGAGPGWKRLLPVAILPTLLTPLILWKLPTDFLPILLGDYLAAHFFVYGALTVLGLVLIRTPIRRATISFPALFLATALLSAYAILAIGLPLDAYLASFLPTRERLPLIGAMLIGTLPYFIADEFLTRGPHAARFGYAVTKLLFVISLGIAVALNPPRLFFLIIIIPVILIFLAVYGLFSLWTYRRTGSPLIAGVANALAIAWAIAVTFPAIAD